MKNIYKKIIVGSIGLVMAIFLIPGNAFAAAPTIATGTATAVTQTTATLNATVNPNGSNTSAWFEVGGTNYGNQNNLTGASPINLTYDMTGLTAGTTYSFRISAVNGSGPVIGSLVSFTTQAAPGGGGGGGGLSSAPAVTTVSPATNITQTTATISGTIDPTTGGSTSVSFELNGNVVASCNQTTLVAGTFNCDLTGLSAGTTYNYRATTVISGGPTIGSLQSNFTTTQRFDTVIGNKRKLFCFTKKNSANFGIFIVL